jgi:hypothetical protein
MNDDYCQGDNDCKLIHSLYNNINSNLEDQNAKLQSQVQKITEIHSTDYQKSNYQITNIENHKFANTILTFIYSFLFLYVAYVIFKLDASRALKVAMIGAFIAYPFIINNVEMLLYEFVLYVYATLTNTVYTKPSY